MKKQYWVDRFNSIPSLFGQKLALKFNITYKEETILSGCELDAAFDWDWNLIRSLCLADLILNKRYAAISDYYAQREPIIMEELDLTQEESNQIKKELKILVVEKTMNRFAKWFTLKFLNK